MVTHDTQRFIGRAVELDTLFQQVVGLRLGVPAQRCLVNLCGVHGIGKSALMAALRQRVSSEFGLSTLSLVLPPLPPAHKAPTLEAKHALLRQLAAETGQPLPAPITDEAAAEAALVAFTAALVEAHTPVLLLVEADHRSAPALFGWIERGLLLPLVRAERVVAVIASRSPLRWREFDTRRRAETLTLAPLSLDDTAAQLGIGPAAATVLYQLTGGLPLANELARDLVAAYPDPAAWDQVALSHAVLVALYQRIGPELPPELRCNLEVLTVVREFALPLFQSLMAFCDQASQARSQALQLLTIKQLQELDLVLWDQASLSYRVAPVLRQLIAGTLRRADPERYAALQHTAIDYYREMLDEVLVSRHIHLLELLWHTLDSQVFLEQTPPALLRDLVARYLTSPDGRHVDLDAVAALRAQLVADSEIIVMLERHGTDLAAMVAVLEVG
jgi:hypothetical protein